MQDVLTTKVLHLPTTVLLHVRLNQSLPLCIQVLVMHCGILLVAANRLTLVVLNRTLKWLCVHCSHNTVKVNQPLIVKIQQFVHTGPKEL